MRQEVSTTATTPDPGREPTRPRGRWRAVFKAALYTALTVTLAAALFVAITAFRYSRIVGATPGRLNTGKHPGELGGWVNPFSGTGGFPWMCGNNFPGADLPFGMLRLSPETRSIVSSSRALNTSGYYYGDNEILGFSHTRLGGTGATDGGHFMVMPSLEPMDTRSLATPRGMRFSHEDELAFPGYYAVQLHNPGVLVELTATERVGVHRYTFSKSRALPHLAIDVSNALGGKRSEESHVRVLPESNEVEGSVRTFGSFASRYGGIKVYFVARFDHPFLSFATWRDGSLVRGSREVEGSRVGADLAFAPQNTNTTIGLRLAISHVSLANARSNLASETGTEAGPTAGTDSFDRILAKAVQAWEERLARIRIHEASDARRRVFYTALYHAFQMPTVFQDANGEYLGFDRKVHRADGFRYFTDMSLWDTFRTAHPIYTLIAPNDQRDMIVSLVTMLAQGGWLPRWPSGNGYSNSMMGTPADIVIAEAYLKGIRDFDVESAFNAMRKTALGPTPPGAAFSGRQGIEHFLSNRYCPKGLVRGSVSRTFEFCWADSAIANLAEALGKTNDTALFRGHSRFYTNLWNPATQYFQPRDAQGVFMEPFKPLLLTYFDRSGELTKDYVEGNALQWRWGAPYDAATMISLFRSRDYFVQELEAFFTKAAPTLGGWSPGSYYWHGNQPDIHAAYLFNEAGRPDLTQRWVRWILDHKYGDNDKGVDGNDDGGTLSAWYVFSALGLYPVAGTDRYELGAPLFEEAESSIGANRLRILADNYQPQRFYVDRVSLNGSPLGRTWIRHSEIEHGGMLRFSMTDIPPTANH